MEELKGRTLAFVAHSFSEVAALSHDLVGLADGLLSGLAKVCSVRVNSNSLKEQTRATTSSVVLNSAAIV